ncbi:trans-sulfuration enzyme family protein [Calderihabitans maritimus]|uniref:cysteine-S-conjugate beta-lyase n=1 Tax=Calderihabitans maritimus TaxID=1246530 RepID=A0A1Z5HWN6_9FIRM|nr:aminotransferase class I/II-fold pyridoxal phosphate-dependent enzyme [Calderihabitans maritimus]GAW93690.1 cystathionine beta-lyase [Calderihabitans maritimus]
MKFGTRLLHTGVEVDENTGAVSVPIYQVSTFHQTSIDNPGPYDYARSGNPTRDALEELIAVLEDGVRGFAFASGMAAISSVFCLFSSGDHVLVCEDVYGGTYRVLTRLFSRFGLEASFVDTTNLENIKKGLRENTRALFLESPSNPLLKITDLAAAAEIAREAGIITIVDNTFMTPYFQRPLELGADIVVHSATKYLGGHSDLIAGLVVTNSKRLAEELAFIQNAFGAILGPQDCWLLMRGLKTLEVRMKQHQRGAMRIAQWLQEQPQVTQVYYPGLPDHPGHQIISRQATGYGGIVSFRVQNGELARKILHQVKIPVLAVSLGAVESIISYPVKMSHASMPEEHRKRLGVTEDLIRLSVGLEDPEDLIADLEQAMQS